ncbi:MAG: hypothetical protein D9V45_11240 [Chloroflexi bacterium]|nr:MAG: hypothetical protein D9V45_11240 [Chloroflexota bacterium]
MNIFVIGDIHGCFTELQELLDKAGVVEDVRIIALGDIVDRGPDSVQVLDFLNNLSTAGCSSATRKRRTFYTD